MLKESIFHWYESSGRNLPWREDITPYKVFLSEIILQQTRVQQGLPYFEKFVQTYPTIIDLARAHEDEIMKLWQGLGYYSRARNMHRAAKMIVEEHGAIFSNEYDSLIKIPGIGPYTAQAILAFAFQKPFVAVDGNIWRITARYFGKSEVFPSTVSRKIAEELWKTWVIINPNHFNNAMMDLGATICLPATPHCHECPISNHCYAFKNQLTSIFPTKPVKATIKNISMIYFIGKRNGRWLIKQRSNQDIWAKMYDFPQLTVDESIENNELAFEIAHEFIEKNRNGMKILEIQPDKIHRLTHRKIYPFFCFVEFLPIFQPESNEKWVDINQLQSLPVPKIIERLIATFN